MKLLSKTVQDVLWLSVICALSVFLTLFLASGNLLDTGYQDWIVQAFRIKTLDLYGFTPWIHNWSSGISLWQSYQFVPHLLTLYISKIFDFSFTQGMVVTTIAFFVLTRTSIYIMLRLLKFSPIAAFISTIISFSIGQYWMGVSDYSLMFGFAFFPLFLYLWIQYFQGKLSFIFPFLSGLAFYIHPLLGINIFLLWMIGNLISSKYLFSKKLLSEVGVFLIASSLFWLPILLNQGYTYANPYLSTSDFLLLPLKNYPNLGLNLPLVALLVFSFINSFVSRVNKWYMPLFIYCFVILIVSLLGVNSQLPHVFAQFQLTRGLPFAGIAIVFLGATLIKTILSKEYFSLKLITAALTTYAFVLGVESSTFQSPIIAKQHTPTISQLEKVISHDQLTEGKIWTSQLGDASYFGDSKLRFTQSYMEHLDSNFLGQRLGQFLTYGNQREVLTKSTVQKINHYLFLTGTKYIVLPNATTLSNSYIKESTGRIAKTFIIRDEKNEYVVIEMNWPIINAAIANNEMIAQKALTIDIDLLNTNSQISADSAISSYYSAISALDEDSVLKTTYPKPNQINITVPSEKSTRFIYISESYDPYWVAYINGKSLPIKSYGPNFMLVELESNTDSGTLILLRPWPNYIYLAVFLIISISIAIIVLKTSERFKKERRFL